MMTPDALRVTLPDESVLSFDGPVTGADIATRLGPGLARAAIGVKVDGELRDLTAAIERDACIELVTLPKGDVPPSDVAMHLLRHSCAHVMAEAIQHLHPGVQLVYGPPVENGFYYDIALPDGERLSADEFEAIEQEMARIIAEDRPFTRYELPVEEGLEKLRAEGSKYKLDNAQRAVEAGGTTLSWYATGGIGSWEDLCRGPHLPSTGKIAAFKVMNLAASYWHGDAASDRLTRVYGVVFHDKKHLQEYLRLLEEARKRDHRAIGRQLGLFHIDEAVGQGLVLWKPNGATIRRELQEFIRGELVRSGYQIVYTPHIGKLGLYRTSGHYPYYRDSQYPPLVDSEHLHRLAREGKSCADLANELERGEVDGYLLKPMNCPHHIKIYSSEPHSYRDLPVRLAEFGTVYRWEQSGETVGMTRVRGFTQDDAHLFCTEEQVAAEISGCLNLVDLILSTLGLTDFRVRVGLRDQDSSKYTGAPELWDMAEKACREAAATLGVPFTEEEGEAAFYGPKIDFIVRDVLGRSWQLGTVQVDYNLPERFDLTYVGADNRPHRPVMIHRAPFGSMERFVGILIEHFAGAFPMWLAPEQVRVLPVSEKVVGYAEKVHAALAEAGLRAGIDRGDERLNAKIKVASAMKTSYLLIVGGRDQEAGTVSVRQRGVGDLGAVPLGEFVAKATDETRRRLLPPEKREG